MLTVSRFDLFTLMGNIAGAFVFYAMIPWDG